MQKRKKKKSACKTGQVDSSCRREPLQDIWSLVHTNIGNKGMICYKKIEYENEGWEDLQERAISNAHDTVDLLDGKQHKIGIFHTVQSSQLPSPPTHT